MTKLSGTSGQVFAGLAETLARGVSRSTKNAGAAGAKTADDSSFHDLLHSVSKLAKQTLNDEGADATAAPGSLRTRLPQPTGHDKLDDDAVHGRAETAREPKSTAKSSDKQSPGDQVAKADVESRQNLAAILGPELAAAPAVTPQTPLPSKDLKEMPARDEQSTATRREVQGANVANLAAADVARSAAVSSTVSRSVVTPSTVTSSNVTRSGATSTPGTRSSAAPSSAGPQAGTLPAAGTQQTESSQADGVASKAMPAAPGFEAVTADVERAARASGREALPETTKVTVVQQETHLPPVAQFSAPQQVANAVVTELKGSPAPAGSAAVDLAAPQGNAPDQPVRILTVNLEPPALGNVTVRLRLVGTEVSVHLAAERRDTSQMLDQQRDSIRALMQSAGYVADVAPVQHGSMDGFQPGQSQPQFAQHQQSPQSQATFDGTGNSSGQSQGEAGQARQEQQSNQETRHDQDVAPPIRRGPVYL
jgi:chemotaxis protein MotD